MCMAVRQIGTGSRPLICTSLTGGDKETIIAELNQVLKKQPDMIEWRADFFKNIADIAQVIAVAKLIKEIAGELPVIFTIRSSREGGQLIALTDREVMELNAEICCNTCVEYVDCELSNEPAHIQCLRVEAGKKGIKIIGSYHNFALTPSRDELAKKFTTAEQYGFDVAKVAVMPQDLDDVLRLRCLSRKMSHDLKKYIEIMFFPIPIASIYQTSVFANGKATLPLLWHH